MDELSGTRRTAAIISSNQPEAICHVFTFQTTAGHAPTVAGQSAIRRRSADRACVSRPVRRLALANGAAHGSRAVLHLLDRQHLAKRVREEHRDQLGAGVAANVVVVRAGTKRRMAIESDSHRSDGSAELGCRDHCLRGVVATIRARGPARSPLALSPMQVHSHGIAIAAVP